MTRARVAVSLWFSAAASADPTVRSVYPDPCEPNAGWGWWALLGVGVFTTLATYVSLAGFAPRRVGAAIVGTLIGAAAGFGVYFIVVMTWVSHCAN